MLFYVKRTGAVLLHYAKRKHANAYECSTQAQMLCVCMCVYVSVFTTLYRMYGSPLLKSLKLSNAIKLLLIPLQLAGLPTLCYCFSKANYNNKAPILI